MSAPLIRVGNGVAVDPCAVVATRNDGEGIPQVKIGDAWLHATAYTGRMDRLIEEINLDRATTTAVTSR